MCVYQCYVYIFVLTYAMQVMRELNRFLLKHLCINQTKTKNTWLWFFYIGCCFWSDIVIFLINKPKIHFLVVVYIERSWLWKVLQILLYLNHVFKGRANPIIFCQLTFFVTILDYFVVNKTQEKVWSGVHVFKRKLM